MTLAPNLQPVVPLLGTWRGEGHGHYPTIRDFDYTEELSFTDIGKPFLVYLQRTWATDGRPMHTETGYLRLPGEGRAELVLAQPTGQTELCQGTITSTADGIVLELSSTVVNSASAKQVDATERRYEVAGDRLSTRFAMAAVGQSMGNHLSSKLMKV